MFVGQPAEDEVSGGKAMLADGLFTRFPKPDYGFAAHVESGLAGTVEVKAGPISSAVDTILITFKGVGAHGSMPDRSIDPIVEGAHFVTDVQSVIAREKDPFKFGVVTVGAFHAGSVSNIISDHADLQLTLRSYDPDVRRVINDGVERTARAVAEMARAPAPDIRHTFTASPVINDPRLTTDTAARLSAALGADRVKYVPVNAPGGTARTSRPIRRSSPARVLSFLARARHWPLPLPACADSPLSIMRTLCISSRRHNVLTLRVAIEAVIET